MLSVFLLKYIKMMSRPKLTVIHLNNNIYIYICIRNKIETMCSCFQLVGQTIELMKITA